MDGIVPLVAEFGSYESRFGFAGGDTPSTRLASSYAKYTTGAAHAAADASAATVGAGALGLSPQRWQHDPRATPSSAKRMRMSQPAVVAGDYAFGHDQLLSFSTASDDTLSTCRARAASGEIKAFFQRGEVRDWQAIEALWQTVLATPSCGRVQSMSASSPMRSGSAPIADRSSSVSSSSLSAHPTSSSPPPPPPAVPAPSLSSLPISSFSSYSCSMPAVLMVEPARLPRADQKRMCELLFEQFNVPAISTIKSASAGVFANGRTSALALDMGHSWTTVMPVKDGFADESKMVRTELAGGVLTEATLEILRTQIRQRRVGAGTTDADAVMSTGLLPASDPRVHASRALFRSLDVSRQWKEQHCCISSVAGSPYVGGGSSSVGSGHSDSQFMLPDGTPVPVQSATWGAGVGDLLFDPSLESLAQVLAANSGPDFSGPSLSLSLSSRCSGYLHLNNLSRMDSVGKVLFQCLSQFDAETRRAMWENMVLFGGTSAIPGMSQRLKRELAPLLPGRAVVKIVETLPAQRAVGSWIGGSIVAAVPSFASSMCLTKAAWAEEGADRAVLLQEYFQ